MSNYTDDFTESEASTNSTTIYFGPEDMLDIFNVLFGLPIYSWVLWLIATGTGSGVASDFFMLNLCVFEIGNCLNSFLFTLCSWVSLPSLIPLTSFLTVLVFTGRPLFQCLICVERYLAVVHPVTFLKYKPFRYRVICCTAAWIITLGFCFCLFFTLHFHITFLCILLLVFLLFFSIQLFCLVAVLRALKQSGPGERGREREEENHMKRRAFYLILITIVSMTVIYVPLTISVLFDILTKGQYQDFSAVGSYCYVFAGFVQPVLYLKRAGKLSCF